jgi:gliding motility-associated-like protein
MMQRGVITILGLLVFLFTAVESSAQQGGDWAWMAGNQPSNAIPNHGILGIPSLTNTPGLRYESSRWVDNQGNLWLFGGQSLDPQGVGAVFADLWKFDIGIGVWVWMNGPSMPFPPDTYVMQGQFSSLVHPAAVNFGSTEFTDKDGNFWLLEGNGTQNLWKYDVGLNMWAWMHGPGNVVNNPGTFGPQNIFSPTNIPGSFTEHHCGWGDTTGLLWFFGAAHLNIPGGSDVLWKFDPQLNQWAWVEGTPASSFVPPVYGIQDVSSPLNTPGSRNVYCSWKSSIDELYFYGNGDFSGAVAGTYCDLWKYNIGTGEWTWMSGLAGAQYPMPVQAPVSICVPSATDFPVRGMEQHLEAEQRGCDLFYTYGGNNTLFRYNAATDEWTLLYDDPLGTVVLGNFQTPSSNVRPGYHAGGVAWVDNSGNFWLYGGLATGSDELFRFSPYPPSADFTCDTSVCVGDTVHFTINTTSLCGISGNLLWDFGDPSTIADTSSVAAAGWIYSQPGSYTATLLAFDSTHCQVWRDTHQVVITVHSQPVVDLGSDTVICPPQTSYLLDAGNTGFTYSWSTGATTQTISPGSSGVYSVTVSDASCSASDTVQLTFAAAPALGDTSICAGQSITLNAGVPGQHYLWSTGDTTASITVNAPGMYTVTVIHPPCSTSSTMQLTLIPLPIVSIGNDTLLCPGATLLLDAQNPGAAWIWNTGANTQTLLVDSSGLYAVTVILQPGNCVESDSVNVHIAQTVNLGPDVSLCGQLNGITLDAGNAGATYLWNTGDTTRTITVTEPGIYTVTAVNGLCTLRDSIVVSGSLGEAMVFIPNSFTPNGDGKNDWFTIVGEGITEYHLLVFNRWGELIFETSNLQGWDGKLNNTVAQNEVYVYRLSYKSSCTGNAEQTRLGHVLLMR